jgi:hypothetical protein
MPNAPSVFTRPLSFILLLNAAGSAFAAPPVLTNLSPRGGERGKPIEVTVAGANLTPQTRLLLPFKATTTPLPDPKPNPAQIRFQVVIDPAVPPGAYPVRVATDDGVSSLALFSVDVLPTVLELEDNSTFDKAQKVAPPVVVDGQCAGGDVDYFRFPAHKGQRFVIEAESARLGSGVLPQLRVTDDRQRLIAADDTQALQGDARVVFTAAADGDYVVEISDTRYKGGAPPHYRLRIADYDVIEEVFPLGGRRGAATTFSLRGPGLAPDLQLTRTLDDGPFRGMASLSPDAPVRPGAPPLRLAVGDLPERIWEKPSGADPRALDVLPPLTINSRLDRPGDVDRCQFAVAPGERYRIAIEAADLGSRLDGVLRVTDAAGTQLAVVDDVDLPAAPGQPAAKTPDPSLDFTVPAGVTLLRLEVRDQRGRGGVNFGYRLTIEPTAADFVVRQPVSEVNVPRGGSALLTVPVVRRGYNGPLQVTVPGLPPGVTVQGGEVPAGATAAVLTLSAEGSAALPAGMVELTLEGRATEPGRDIRRVGEQRLPYGIPLTLSHFALGLTAIEPFAVTGPPTIELVKGYPSTVSVRLVRAKDLGALPILATATDPRTPPAGFTITPSQPTAEATAMFTITAGAAAPEGAMDLALEAKGKVANVDRTVEGPALKVTVLRPFELQLAAPTLSLAPGQTVALRGKIVRQHVFKEAVQLKLDGLPAGVTLVAPPAAVPADKSDFEIMLKVDATAAPAPAALSLTGSTTLAGAAYALPAATVQGTVGK